MWESLDFSNLGCLTIFHLILPLQSEFPFIPLVLAPPQLSDPESKFLLASSPCKVAAIINPRIVVSPPFPVLSLPSHHFNDALDSRTTLRSVYTAHGTDCGDLVEQWNIKSDDGVCGLWFEADAVWILHVQLPLCMVCLGCGSRDCVEVV